MAKSFLKGMCWGAAIGVGLVSSLSVIDGRSADGSIASKNFAEVRPEVLRVPDSSPPAAGLKAQEGAVPEPDKLAEAPPETRAVGSALQAGTGDEKKAALLSPAPSGEQGSRAVTSSPGTKNGTAVVFASPETDAAVADDQHAAQPSGAATPKAGVPVELPPAPDVSTPGSVQSLAALKSDHPSQSVAGRETTGVTPSVAAEPRPETAVQISDHAPVVLDTLDQPAPLNREVVGVTRVTSEAAPPAMENRAQLSMPPFADKKASEAESLPARVVVSQSIQAPLPGGVIENPAAVRVNRDRVPSQLDAQDLAGIAIRDREVSSLVTGPAAAFVSPAALEPDAAKAAGDAGNLAPDEPAEPIVVTVNRLPRLGQDEISDDIPPEVEVPLSPQNDEMKPAQPVERFAVSFENPEGKPLMSIVLMDDGLAGRDRDAVLTALQAVPYPVSIAVDALLPDAAERMRVFRTAGFEVLAMLDLPAGATAGDADVNLSAALGSMTEVVGVLEGVGTGVQTTPDAGLQVAEILAQTGHGFVTQDRGLNTVQKRAAQNGVLSGVVFRDFDGGTQRITAIPRLLEQAAFRARQDGSVIMLGRLRQETLHALMLWHAQDRAKTVAMSPVSAALRVE